MVGVNGSRIGPALVDLAVTEAALYRAPLLITHVWPGRYAGAYRGHGAVPSRADAERLLELSAGRARQLAASVPVTTELLDGGAANQLAETSRRARLLVLGHRDEVYARPTWGSTTAYLAHQSRCPVMVYRGVVPVDGPVVVATSSRPEECDATLGYAFERAALVSAPLTAIHIWTRPGAADGIPPIVRPGAYAEERAVADQALAEVLAGWTARFPDVPVERLVVGDFDMALTIERALRRGRLMVAGIGQSGSFAELLCSAREARAVVRKTSPTVLVPRESARRGNPVVSLQYPRDRV
ncbi:universal stress protein [Winogradskya consettensis]|uniref:Universal stress protein n=1 Tax=Winogradskya consettensis TaxID=113560 RepID=A0A919VVI4_9ACTN|nr:universal stress protein [Actinoplanes consettensis]GIM76720.1 universal stress protein [Actinoplanes consettensis]